MNDPALREAARRHLGTSLEPLLHLYPFGDIMAFYDERIAAGHSADDVRELINDQDWWGIGFGCPHAYHECWKAAVREIETGEPQPGPASVKLFSMPNQST
jgi:hypothetical protein